MSSRIIPTESEEQKALFQWARLMEGRYPELRLMFAVPNGGVRRPATAGRLKAEGVKSGVPDICLPVARHGYHALYIEMKRLSGGGTSPEQKDWLDALNRQGNKAIVCRGWVKAKEAIEEYLDESDVLPFED
jgi:hypothetical protein